MRRLSFIFSLILVSASAPRSRWPPTTRRWGGRQTEGWSWRKQVSPRGPALRRRAVGLGADPPARLSQSGALRDVRQRVLEIVEPDRLAQIVVHSGGEAALAVAGQSVCGEGDDVRLIARGAADAARDV